MDGAQAVDHPGQRVFRAHAADAWRHNEEVARADLATHGQPRRELSIEEVTMEAPVRLDLDLDPVEAPHLAGCHQLGRRSQLLPGVGSEEPLGAHLDARVADVAGNSNVVVGPRGHDGRAVEVETARRGLRSWPAHVRLISRG